LSWISVEPVIRPKEALLIITRLVKDWTTNAMPSHFKLGKLSGHDAETRAIEKSIDWRKYRDEACAILDAAGYKRIHEPGVFEVGVYYVKRELDEAAVK